MREWNKMNRIMLIAIAVLSILSAGLGAAWKIDSMASSILAEKIAVEAVAEKLRAKEDELELEREWSRSRDKAIESLLEIDQGIKEVQATVESQNRANRKALAELVRNDQEVRDYLLMFVPNALGVRYGREETIDPTKYGSSGEVLSEPLLDAGAKASEDK